ncbi:MAG: P-loop containing nucleoside triphosphate hydrolase protein, partial [Olpidium bornovanus]
ICYFAFPGWSPAPRRWCHRHIFWLGRLGRPPREVRAAARQHSRPTEGGGGARATGNDRADAARRPEAVRQMSPLSSSGGNLDGVRFDDGDEFDDGDDGFFEDDAFLREFEAAEANALAAGLAGGRGTPGEAGPPPPPPPPPPPRPLPQVAPPPLEPRLGAFGLLAQRSTAVTGGIRSADSRGAACGSAAGGDRPKRLGAPLRDGASSGGAGPRQTTLFESFRSSQADFLGFDPDAVRSWVYPMNYPVRDYQFAIVCKALFNNTLVSIPTGLGKTFIAAVVMYNFYRWFPRSKVLFMAPTKPLVAQQIRACHDVCGIPQADSVELTGAQNPESRRAAWAGKRVFFLTPQVLHNDLRTEACPAAEVSCVIVDEAHRATGNHANCEVIRELSRRNREFRVVGLTATPGTKVESIQAVVDNMLISKIELRTEDSPDIKPYTFQTQRDPIVVPL